MAGAANSNSGGYDDWYLPSKDELELIYNTIGQFDSWTIYNSQVKLPDPAYYWSSSEINNNSAWFFSFTDGDNHWFYKDRSYNVRVIRAF